MFSSKTLISVKNLKDMDILDDKGVSKLSAIFFFKGTTPLRFETVN